ncbi:hypothetical protein Dda_7587 [Drechslerella dactyloides]|uniref:Uncharacterized protein n=1 Tax=Drechslerella dactyloides TaxID=74499 RepID=A0AAD6NIF6_DREDA|nr:hypothetical protein Dda_7587 [Drechslerella dactyloides]
MEPDPQPQETPSHSRLTSLPEELIEEICLQLSDDVWGAGTMGPNTEALSALHRTSKLLNRIAAPILYRQFHCGSRMTRTAKFLKTISYRPDLAGLVHDLRISRPTWTDLPDEDIEFFTAASTQLGLDLEAMDNAEPGDVWDKYRYEIVSQLLISQTYNLKRLGFIVINRRSRDGRGAFVLLQQLAAQDLDLFSLFNLEQFSYSHSDGHEVGFDYFEGLLKLAPKIQSVCATCFNPWKDDSREPVNIYRVTDLTLRDGLISVYGLHTIVVSCGKLERFVLEDGTVERFTSKARRATMCLAISQVVQVLAFHKNWLRHLDLRLAGDWCSHHAYVEYCRQGDLRVSVKSFTSLETFKMDGEDILFPEDHTNAFVNMLPRSIRRFHFQNARKEAPANMITLANSLGADFPFLKEVLLNPYPGSQHKARIAAVIFDKSEIEILSQLFKAAGVTFLKKVPTRYDSYPVPVKW